MQGGALRGGTVANAVLARFSTIKPISFTAIPLFPTNYFLLTFFYFLLFLLLYSFSGKMKFSTTTVFISLLAGALAGPLLATGGADKRDVTVAARSGAAVADAYTIKARVADGDDDDDESALDKRVPKKKAAAAKAAADKAAADKAAAGNDAAAADKAAAGGANGAAKDVASIPPLN
ncbi:hypothetical protein CCM_02115 [Cordyceps militaris CM01]|uniref:Uncharacterized protein n=1 Tax=Cordyceps militaris (strain CM01) TaxID=983644 RepID=G3JCN3_CORMM|nr:uncharacterized protein CCM_02115 [Cordyceps militaris CM01]EGX93845.1 hypothetical protein CCM_02115 [Cordyceps militaris CM01]